MNTTALEPGTDGRRRRRMHSDEFKANAVASCLQPGISMAAVAMANEINANLLRRWVQATEMRHGAPLADAPPMPKRQVAQAPAAFVPMQLPAKTAATDIRIELRRGATSISVAWPLDAGGECAAWMRELLR